jgi:hypothetical protein
VAQVSRDGRPELCEDVTDELLVSSARSEEHLKIMRELGMRSVIDANG